MVKKEDVNIENTNNIFDIIHHSAPKNQEGLQIDQPKQPDQQVTKVAEKAAAAPAERGRGRARGRGRGRGRGAGRGGRGAAAAAAAESRGNGSPPRRGRGRGRGKKEPEVPSRDVAKQPSIQEPDLFETTQNMQLNQTIKSIKELDQENLEMKIDDAKSESLGDLSNKHQMKKVKSDDGNQIQEDFGEKASVARSHSVTEFDHYRNKIEGNNVAIKKDLQIVTEICNNRVLDEID